MQWMNGCLVWFTGLLVVGTAVCQESTVDFRRDVRPILSEFCFQCHGFDEQAREADLRLDRYDEATQPAGSGSPALVPGKPEQSELVRRITSEDPDERMPPSSTGKSLTPNQVAILRTWIGQGAPYASHWAFERPIAARIPPIQLNEWPRNRIDSLVLHRLERDSLPPAKIAEPERLLRRVSLDLIGLPPTIDDLDRFLKSAETNFWAAYEAEVDRLLSSPHFGERLAIDWLDAARYADTNGYFGDNPRQAWPWRDWLIQALNRNMPFDQFTIEQLAGDLLPEPTREQRIATGFHRNSMANNETGIIDEEYRVEAVADRVETTAAVWLGMTIGCAQCHDHKYDPISQREYYQLFAFFNQSVEPGLITKDDPPPVLEVPTASQQAEIQRRAEERGAAETAFNAASGKLDAEIAAWQATALAQLPALPSGGEWIHDFDREASDVQALGTTLQLERGIRGQAAKFDATQHLEARPSFDPDGPWAIGVWLHTTNSLAGVWSKIEPEGHRRGIELIWQKGKLHINLVHQWGADEIVAKTRDPLALNAWHHVVVAYNGSRRGGGLQVFVNGRPLTLTIDRDQLSGSLQCDEPLRIGRRDSGLGFYGLLDEFRILPRIVGKDEVEAWFDSERLQGILNRLPEDRTASDQAILKEYFIEHLANDDVRQAYSNLQRARAVERAARAAVPTTLVMQDLAEPRKTHLLVRGQYDKRSDEVRPEVPAIFPRLPEGAPSNRLGFARWLVSRDHPLTARVTVNRLWQMLFGEGLVRTPNDFGSQGELPTHPELLDDLSVQFVGSGWDVKALVRSIVTSATYCQSSRANGSAAALDPENRLLSRGPRFRLPAELVRDQALAISDLLVRRIGGPSVRPYQPDGLWEAVSYNADDTYVPDQSDGLWRRSLYTYWKRQVPPPTLLTLDANTREKCILKRSRTNTPLQALVVLNDPTFVEAARVLAARTMARPGTDDDRLRWMFRTSTSRWPESHELPLLQSLLARRMEAFRADPESARQLLDVGESPVPDSLDTNALAAWTIVAHTLLNLDEVVTRR